MFLMLPGLGWGDIGTTTIDDSAHAAPAAADTLVQGALLLLAVESKADGVVALPRW